MIFIAFYTTPHDSVGVLWFHVGYCVSVRPSVVRPSVLRFRMKTWVNINGFSPNLVRALILWRSGLGLLIGKFRQSFTELSARDTPVFSFPDDNLNKHQWIFTKLGMCIDIVEILFGIANWQISSKFDGVFCPIHAHIFVFGTISWVNVKGFQPNLIHALILRRSSLGLLMSKFPQCLTELSARDTIMAGYYSLTFYSNPPMNALQTRTKIKTIQSEMLIHCTKRKLTMISTMK